MFDAESVLALKFRCAKTGRQFLVLFARQAPSLKFTIVKIVDERNVTLEEAAYLEPESAASQIKDGLQNIATTLSKLVASGVSRNLVPTRGARQEQTSANTQNLFSKFKPGKTAYDMDDLDFTGWYCPCCGHAKENRVETLFVQCNRCHEYVCGSRIEKTFDGKKMFVCHKGCGNRSGMGGSTLSSMSGVSGQQTKRTLIDNRSTNPRLPPSQAPRLPNKKK